MDLETFDFDSLTDEQFNKFIWALDEIKSRPKKVSVEELEDEFDVKSRYLLSNDHYELGEIYLSEFIELLFERKSANDKGSMVIPFEERNSREYEIWIDQRRRGRRNKSDAVDLSREGHNVQPVDYSSYRMWRYNPVVFYKEGKKAIHRLLLKDDEDTLNFLESRKFAIMSPVTYVGRTSSYKNARFLYAFAIDLDGVSFHEVRALLRGMTTGVYPEANIIVNSGHGVHVYYLLESPVAMYETRVRLLNKLKSGITRIVWLVSRLGSPQVQSVVQGFRLPGTLTKFGKPIRAFYNQQVPLHTLESLNKYLGAYKLTDEEIAQLKDWHPHNPSRVTRAEAQELWPEWYASRVIGRRRVGKKWKVNRGLYDWWLKKMQDGSDVTVHHRYWCVLTLVVFAVKCGIPRDEVLKDAMSLVPVFDNKTESVDNPFTEDDVMDAMRAYDEEYNKWPLRVIESTTGIRIKKNRRNGREQSTHLKRIRALQDFDYPAGEWRDGNGRKKGSVVEASQSRCAAIVRAWRMEHPESTNKALCARQMGLSRPTVHRWWDDAQPKAENPSLS